MPTNTGVLSAAVVAIHTAATPAATPAACAVDGSATGFAALRAAGVSTHPAASAAWLRAFHLALDAAFVGTITAVLVPKLAAAVPAGLAVGNIVACRGPYLTCREGYRGPCRGMSWHVSRHAATCCKQVNKCDVNEQGPAGQPAYELRVMVPSPWCGHGDRNSIWSEAP